MGGKRLELVRRAEYGQSGHCRKPGGELPGKGGGCVEAGADGGAALGDSEQVRGRLPDTSDSQFELCRITGEFLSEGERHRILQMGAADLDNGCEGLGL